MEIADSEGYFFFGLTVAENEKDGLLIHSTPSGFSPGKVRIFRGIFFDNSRDTHDTYSDIKLEPNASGFGPYDIGLIGCEFRGSSDAIKQKYAIEDTSTYPRPVLLSACYFGPSSYPNGSSYPRQPQRDCFDNDKAAWLTEGELQYIYVDSANRTVYDLQLPGSFVLVNAFSDDVDVRLPSIQKMAIGTVLYVAKQDAVTGHTVSISAANGETINGGSSVSMTGSPALQSFMIVHAGAEWTAVKTA